MDEILKKVPEKSRKKVKQQKQPEWINPMLAKLTHDEFSDADWVYERKLDGIRCLIFKDGREVRIMSRNGNDLSENYPEIVEVLQKQPEEKFIIDGEMVAFEGEVTSFAALQKRMHLRDPEEIRGRKTAVFFYVFDLIHIRNLDISTLGVLERKKLLKESIKFKDPIRYTTHRKGKGLEFFQEACLDKWEGLIAKKAISKYTFGRSSSWLKFKCTNQQELVIGGYSEPSGFRTGFGALLSGYHENGNLLYAGRVAPVLMKSSWRACTGK